MEVDTSMKIPNWEATRLDKRKDIIEELACEGPDVFYDDFVTLHHAIYQKNLQNISLQHVSI